MDRKKVCVMLDNGHAYETPGKRSPILDKELQEKYGTDRLYEYKWNRDMVSVLISKLSKLGYNVFDVTPEEKEDIGLSKRAARANEHIEKMNKEGKTCIFISVHVNAGPTEGWGNYKGWSVWTTKGQNKSDDLAEELWKVAAEELPKYGMKTRQDVSDGDHDYEENFTVIYKTNCPAVLTENMFMNDKQECEWILSDEGKEVISEIHIKGINNYIDKL